MDKKPECVNCHQPMKLVKTQKTTENRHYRIRRYHCDLCNYGESVYAEGEIDESNTNRAVKAASKL